MYYTDTAQTAQRFPKGFTSRCNSNVQGLNAMQGTCSPLAAAWLLRPCPIMETINQQVLYFLPLEKTYSHPAFGYPKECRHTATKAVMHCLCRLGPGEGYPNLKAPNQPAMIYRRSKRPHSAGEQHQNTPICLSITPTEAQ